MQTFTNVLITLAVMATILTSTASAWTISFFNTDVCNKPKSGEWNMATYSGYSPEAPSECQIIGDPGNDCNWWKNTNNGKNFEKLPCTNPM